MIKKFAKFWIDNAKVTIVLILVTVIAGIGSYILIPKQYNPDIPVPAFNIIVPAPGFSAKEVEHLVVEPLEDRINEIKDIDHIYGISNPNFGVVMVQFKVGTDKEKATTRLYNKIFENLGQKPIGVKDPIIKKMDSDDFPIYTFAIVGGQKRDKRSEENKLGSISNSGLKLDNKNNLIKSHQNNSSDLILLRKIALDVSNKLKFIPGTSVFYLVGGYPDNVNVILDLNKLKAKHIDIMQVYQAIKENNLNFPAGELKLNKVEGTITVDGNMGNLDKLKKLVVGNYNGKPVYLQEVAYIFKGVPERTHYSFVSLDGKTFKNAVFIGIAKKKSVNAVTLSKKIKEKLKELEKTLPAGYKFVTVDDQGKVAEDSTNSLLINLAESVIIVFLVLLVYLGFRDAINNAAAIPLVLFMVFLIAFVVHDNINRIVLFALVLALGMLVDNSTVVIENIARHLKEKKPDETVKDAILKAVDEVGVGVVLATITRILALVAMFFVTGMMGSYMGGVPKYVIISLLVSLLVAFSINPFIAYISYKNPKVLEKIHKKGEGKHKEAKIYKIYEKFMGNFLGERNKTKRKLFKLAFWGSLIAVLVIPPALGIFKMGMLPKDNKNQVYVWIDGQRNWSVEKSKQVAEYVKDVISKFQAPKKFDYLTGDNIVKNVDYWIGIAPVIDFSNAFRGVQFRSMPYQISMRVNLVDKEKRAVSSIDWTMKFRNYLEKQVRKKYPDAKIRVLEDPPGPPVRATFMLKVEGDRSTDYKDLESLAVWLKKKLEPLLSKDQVVDLYTTKDTYKTDYRIQIDHQLLSSYGLTVQQVAYTLYNIFQGANVSLVHNQHTREPIDIYLSVLTGQKYNPDIFNYITFMNKQGKKIYLKQFAKIEKQALEHAIYTEDKYKSVYVYGEVGNNTIFYIALHTTLAMIKDRFWEGKYKVVSFNPYEVNIEDVKTHQKYKIAWGGERKLSLDTFRDLGIAMFMALLAIYFLMVAQFKSFKIAGIIMLTFLLGLFGIMPGFSLIYVLNGTIFTAPSMIGVIALAGIVVGNAIILIEYVNQLLKQGQNKTLALIKAGKTRMRAIIITSLTTVLGSMTILGDPVWGGLGRSIVWGLTASAILTLIVIPIFLYDAIQFREDKMDYELDETIPME